MGFTRIRIQPHFKNRIRTRQKHPDPVLLSVVSVPRFIMCSHPESSGEGGNSVLGGGVGGGCVHVPYNYSFLNVYLLFFI